MVVSETAHLSGGIFDSCDMSFFCRGAAQFGRIRRCCLVGLEIPDLKRECTKR